MSERERTKAPPAGPWQWIVPVFRTSNSDFIQKCGLDAYFFLRYLRTLLKIFVPLAIVILPILIPVNNVGGRGNNFAVGKYSRNSTLYTNVQGLDQLAWGNVRPENNNRYWTHLLLAVVVVVYTCYVFFDELRGYIRLRQAYLTSPQHRLRASATTVLVTAIPPKWCTFEALDGLYDVFPGGIRNIWVNRNFDELNEKVKVRNQIAVTLENAETALIKNVKKAHLKKLKAQVKKAGREPKEKKLEQRGGGLDGESMAESPGISSGNPHQVRHTLDEVLADCSGGAPQGSSGGGRRNLVPIPILGQGIEAVGHGIDNIGRSVFKGLKQVGKNVDDRLTTRGGFVSDADASGDDIALTYDTAPHNQSTVSENSSSATRYPHANNATALEDHYQTPPDENTIRPSSLEDEGAPGKSQAGQLPELPQQRNQSRLDIAHENSGIDERLKRSSIYENPQRLGQAGKPNKAGLKFWNHGRSAPFGIPSPTPHGLEGEEFPLSNAKGGNSQAATDGLSVEDAKRKQKIPKHSKTNEYPVAFNADYGPNDDGEPAWKTYLSEKDRDTMRLPIFGWAWMPSLPLIGQKVDTIDYCRKELARLNVEIEQDQREPEKFPLLNSAFVQFNHQVAAHMACQAVSHHTPLHMAPRVVEISPDDVIWDNMSIRWWESYIRTGCVYVLIAGLIIGWAFPVTFTGLLSQVKYLTDNYRWLSWLAKSPTWVLSIVQGVLPPIFLAILLSLLPVILRFLARTQGDHTGMAVELSVQTFYFFFLFVQVFLIVSISSGITTVISDIAQGPQNLPSILASNLPKAANYFFSYMLLQALSVSAGALAQVLSLFKWFFMAPLFDSTARQKWSRQTSLPDMQWGTFFPVYTNLAAIGELHD